MKSKDLIIVTGVGRCGTSVFMEYLKGIGVNTGNLLWHEALRAGNEHSRGTQINKRLGVYFTTGNTVDNAWLKESIENIDVDIIKDPSFLVHPESIAYWQKYANIKVIFMTRDHKDIIDSCRKVPFASSPNFRCFEDLIDKHEKEFLGYLKKYKIPVHKIKYPDYMIQKAWVNEMLESIGIKLPVNERTIWKHTFKI